MEHSSDKPIHTKKPTNLKESNGDVEVDSIKFIDFKKQKEEYKKEIRRKSNSTLRRWERQKE